MPSRWAADAGAAAHVIVERLTERLLVDGMDGHHLQRVRRLRPGEIMTAGDGHGRWRPYVVTTSAQGSVTLSATGEPETEPTLAPRLGVAFALTKAARPEQVAAHLTELGVERIVPMHSRRAVVRWEGDRASVATARLRRVVREAAMQCRRARLPVVEDPVPLDALCRHPGLVVAHSGGRGPEALDAPSGGAWLLLVGPEGGFDPDELALLAHAPRLAVGPYVLRAETAAVAAAAVLTVRRHAVSTAGEH